MAVLVELLPVPKVLEKTREARQLFWCSSMCLSVCLSLLVRVQHLWLSHTFWKGVLSPESAPAGACERAKGF